jgi:Flp pilus assembly protein TadG
MTTGAVWQRLRRRATILRATSDRGSAVVEAVIILPVIVILSMFLIQFALVWHGRHLAESAAQNAVTAAAGYQSTAGRGQQSAAEFLAQVAPNLLTARIITVDRAPTEVTARIDAHVLTVVPFADFTVTATASGPVERFAGDNP